MKQKTKELQLTLHNCNNCPYLEWMWDAKKEQAEYVCSHDEGQGLVITASQLENQKEVIADDAIDFPRWCPLPENKKGPGVRVGLTGLIIRDGKILLGLRKNTETASGQWAFPGGRMDYGETPEDGIVREIIEETGMAADIFSVTFLTYKNEFFPTQDRHYTSLVFMVENVEGEPELKEPDKCERWEWFDPFSLPENTFWACKQVIKEKDFLIKGMIMGQSCDDFPVDLTDEEIAELEAEEKDAKH